MRFQNRHPGVLLTYYVGMLIGLLCSSHPIYLGIFCCCGILTVCLHWKKGGLPWLLLLVALVTLVCGIYIYTHHYGETKLGMLQGENYLTLEVLCYTGILFIKWLGIFLILWDMAHIFTLEKYTYLMGRIWPGGALYMSLAGRIVPRMREQGKAIYKGQRLLGLWKGKALLRTPGCLLTWTGDVIAAEYQGMRSRGIRLKGRSQFVIYRFSGKDRTTVLLLVTGFVIYLMAYLLGQATMYFDPELVFVKPGIINVCFYICTAIYGCFPLWNELCNTISSKGKCS